MKTIQADCSTPVEHVTLAAPRVPRDLQHYAGLTQVRQSVSARMRDCELPSAFLDATVQHALNSLNRNTVAARAGKRRAVDKAVRVLEAE